MFVSLSQEAVQPLRIERPAVERPGVVELDQKENAVRPLTALADVGRFLKDHQTVVYSAGNPRLVTVSSSSVSKRKPSSSVKTIGHQGKKVTRTKFVDGVKSAAENIAKVENATDVTSAASCALQQEAKSVFG